MAREYKFWVRTVKEVRNIIEIYSAACGGPGYVEKDGNKVLSMQPAEADREIVEEFRVLTPMEQYILENKHPDLWEDIDNDKTEN